MSWEDQGRQYHQWFGHGTSAQDTIDGPKPGAEPATEAHRAAFVAISAGHDLPNPLRNQNAQALQQNGLKNLKESLPIWAQGCDMPPDQFRKHLVGPKFTAQSAADLQALGRAFRKASSLDDLTRASDLLAKAIEQEGPANLAYKLRWARDESRYALANGLITTVAAPALRAPGEIVWPLLREAARAAIPLARTAVAVGTAIAAAPEAAQLAVTGAILLRASRDGVTKVAVAGYGEADRGVAPVSAEVNARDRTVLLYHGRTIDLSVREGTHTVFLTVDADGVLTNVAGQPVGRLSNGDVILNEGFTPRDLFKGPGSFVYNSMAGPEEDFDSQPPVAGKRSSDIDKMVEEARAKTRQRVRADEGSNKGGPLDDRHLAEAKGEIEGIYPKDDQGNDILDHAKAKETGEKPKPFDHVQEAQDAIQGLDNDIATLERKVDHHERYTDPPPNGSIAEAQRLLGRMKELHDRVRQSVPDGAEIKYVHPCD